MLQTEQDIFACKKNIAQKLLKLPGIHSVGIGNKITAGRYSGKVAIVVSVDRKIPTRELDSSQIVPSEIDGFPTDVIVRPRRPSVNYEFDAASTDDDFRAYSPIVGGCRISAQYGTGAGTAGVIVMSPNGKPAILSNRHVLKDSGNVYQPGKYYAKAADEHLVATVTGYAQNFDCAYAELLPEIKWSNYMLDIGPIQGTYDVTEYDLPYSVRKRGGMTGITNCVVTQLYVEGIDRDNEPYSATMVVEGNAGQAGDSGSMLVDDQYRIVGQLYYLYGEYAHAYAIDELIRDIGFSVINTANPTLYMVHQGRNEYRCFEAERIEDHWRGDVLIHPWDSYGTWGGPKLVTYQNQIYNIRQSSSNSDVWCAKFDNIWHDDVKLSPTNDRNNYYGTTGAPAVAVYKGLLYCIHEGSQMTYQLWCFTTDGVSWSDDVLLAPTGNPGERYKAWFPPDLVVFQGKLWCFYTYDYRLWCFTFDGTTWSNPVKLAPTNDPGNYYGSGARPSVLTYKDKLHCFHLGSNYGNTDNIWHFTYDGSTWSADEKLAPTSDPGNYYGCSYGPSAIVRNGKILCVHEGSNFSKDIWYFTFDGDTWSPDIQLPPADFGTDYEPGLAHLQFYDGAFQNATQLNTVIQSPLRPAACSFNNNLYLFWKADDRSDRICYSTSSNGSSWSEPRTLSDADSTVDAPAACVFESNNQPYVFWRAQDDSGAIFYSTSTDGSTWSTGERINAVDSSSNTPMACSSVSNRLYVFYKARWSDDIYYSYSSDGKAWNNGKVINNSDKTWVSPTACDYQGNLFVFWKAADSSNSIYYSVSTDGEHWAAGRRINEYDVASDIISVCVRNRKIYLFWRIADSTNTIYFTSSGNGGLTWNRGRPINTIDTSPFSPTSCIHNNRMYLFFKSNSDNTLFYTTDVRI